MYQAHEQLIALNKANVEAATSPAANPGKKKAT